MKDRLRGVGLALAAALLAAGCEQELDLELDDAESVVVPAAPALEKRGYVSRPCGFDMTRNGIIGEPADCHVCDGETTDPDGDGVEEDLIYVDAEWGSDLEGDGGPWSPYKTIQFAWNVADGPRNGAEDIICFRGFSQEELITPGTSGLPGTYTVPRSGSQARDWKLPVDPTMLVGWDEDNDGEYPPYDPDDTAVLDGSGDGGMRGLSTVFRLGPVNDYLEIAHLYIQDYGRFSPGVDSGFLRFGPRRGGVDYTYYHDIELYSLNRERPADGGKDFAINIFNSGLHWANFTNLLFEDNGGWFTRGSGPDNGPDEGPLRWQNITRRVRSCDFSVCGGKAAGYPGFKIWGYISRIEILDSVWDTNVVFWEPNPNGGHGGRVIVAGQCTQDWTIRNNEFIDPSVAFRIQAASYDYCAGDNARPVDKVVFDRNIVRNSYSSWGFGNYGIDILARSVDRGEGDAAGEVVGDVEITNNFLATSKSPWEACILAAIGNYAASPPGRLVIANNTCVGEIRRYAAISIGSVATGEDPTYRQQNVVLKNNIVAGLGDGQANVQMEYVPDHLVSDFNVFDDAGGYGWQDEETEDLAAWQKALGVDQGSRECEPEFEDSGAGDLHLSRTDTCAQSRGENLSELTLVDVDGDPRPPAGAWDAGADQVGQAASEDPPFRFAGEPSGVIPGGGWQVAIGLETNEAATCRWRREPETTYGSMTDTFAVTGGRQHSANFVDPAHGEEHHFYVRCVDTLGHANLDDFEITFTLADLATGLLGHWGFEEGSGATASDASGKGHHGSLEGRPIRRAGKVAGGLGFDGHQDHVVVDAAADLDQLEAFTLAAWVKVRASSREQVIADKRDEWDDGFALYVEPGGKLLAYLNQESLTGSKLVIDDEWHHVAAVYDGEDLWLYVDGEEDAWNWLGAGVMETEGELTIGGPAWDPGDPSYFAGVLDEVRLYDRPLGEKEVDDLSELE